MKKYTWFFLLLFLSNVFVNCTNDNSKNTSSNNENLNSSKPAVLQRLQLSSIGQSPTFENAILQMKYPEEYGVMEENNVPFLYNVINFKLGEQTGNANKNGFANSDKGQHINLILNNDSYSTHITPEFEKTLSDGYYVALSFLSRSYHESVKHPEAYVLRDFSVGDTTGLTSIDLTKPQIFYNRPIGVYIEDETKNVMLDYYLVNVTLSALGYYVVATIDDHEFAFKEWKTYAIQGLLKGDHTIKLELFDSTGNSVESQFNPAERIFTLKES